MVKGNALRKLKTGECKRTYLLNPGLQEKDFS
jgi:hypothetical protein